jgi:hypothetical protein
MSVRDLPTSDLRASEVVRPRPLRVGTSLQAVLIDSDGGELAVEVTDLSSGGFRLHTTEPLIAGEQVRLRVERHGAFPAQVQWVEGHEAGGRFLEPISFLK